MSNNSYDRPLIFKYSNRINCHGNRIIGMNNNNNSGGGGGGGGWLSMLISLIMICAFVHYRTFSCHCLSIINNNNNNVNNDDNNVNIVKNITNTSINHRSQPALLHRQNDHHSKQLLSDQFVVQIRGGHELARQLANDHGFTYLGHVSFFNTKLTTIMLLYYIIYLTMNDVITGQKHRFLVFFEIS